MLILELFLTHGKCYCCVLSFIYQIAYLEKSRFLRSKFSLKGKDFKIKVKNSQVNF